MTRSERGWWRGMQKKKTEPKQVTWGSKQRQIMMLFAPILHLLHPLHHFCQAKRTVYL